MGRRDQRLRLTVWSAAGRLVRALCHQEMKDPEISRTATSGFFELHLMLYAWCSLIVLLQLKGKQKQMRHPQVTWCLVKALRRWVTTDAEVRARSGEGLFERDVSQRLVDLQ